MKVYQVKHKSGKKYRPEIRNARPAGDSIAIAREKTKIKPEDRPEIKQQEEDFQLVDSGDIIKNLHALQSKYDLNAITLSTKDGLVIATTSERGQDDAAHYSQVLKPEDGQSIPGIRLFFSDHKGSAVVGIIRSDYQLTDSTVKSIRIDTEKIMNWWI